MEDEHMSSKPRGWLNWLSRGMLGAGGTDDSSQFSGVISDDVVKVSLITPFPFTSLSLHCL
uniref:Vacuolar protein sorting-associated protein n=1 Tax=Solanum tuberosum TaxID=4113 RepID=M1C3E1_SOLTU